MLDSGHCGVVVHLDNDSVYASHLWFEKLLMEVKVRVSYADHGARDNSWIESFWGRFGTENAQLILEAKTLEEVKGIVAEQINYYKRKRKLSTLD